ncbi:dipeptide/tripeptide permease [Microbulbifer rhizosphaerae]|uniref:Dipeptide/tripeptide permease n=1 Tax=Microbulbifer rhizosphaerae TaxID=1562603 RepID=A0A7W4WCW4_9GAMM|nr:dipeptide/tripeptide permease [Microbulbifer rhizosphaerae]
MVFWAGFEQAAGSMNLFAKYNTDLMIGGWEMPASWLQMVNPLFIIILAPVIASIWVGLMMGLWFAFIGIANKGAAEIGKLVGETGPLATFGGVAVAAIGAGILLYFLREKLVDWMHGVEAVHLKVGDSTREEVGITADHEGMPPRHFNP